MSIDTPVERSISFAKQNTKSQEDTKDDAEKKKKQEPRNYSVYGLIDAQGTVQYVGRTTSLVGTVRRHHKNPYRQHLTLVPFETCLTYQEARGLEQFYIEYFQTLNKANKMNNQISGVDKNKPHKWIPSRKAATEYYLNLLAGSENETYVGG